MVARVWLRAAAQVRLHAMGAHSLRKFHASSAVLARQGRRAGRATRATREPSATTSAHFEDRDSNEQVRTKSATFFTQDELDEDPRLLLDAADNDDDDDAELDDEGKEFLEGVDELFALDPKGFERRLAQIELSEDESQSRPRKLYEEAEDGAFELNRGKARSGWDHDDDEDEDEEMDRAERIPKKRLIRMLDEFDQLKSSTTGKNAESMALPKAKLTAPLEKKEKKGNAEKVSHRQDRVESAVMGFIQNLLLEDADVTEANVVAHIVEASAAPDLRRVVLYWEPVRRGSENQLIAKKKVLGVKLRLEKLEKWIRMSVARHLNLKYAPVIQFKQRKQTENDETRKLFDREMAWLDRFQ